MRIDYLIGAGQPDPVNQARVVSRIGENSVARFQNSGEQSDIRGVSRAKIKRRLGSREFREGGFRGFPFGAVAGKQARAG